MLVQVKAGGQRARARNTHASWVCWVSNIARASCDFLQALASIKPPRRGAVRSLPGIISPRFMLATAQIDLL
jgi:hypothetical protein